MSFEPKRKSRARLFDATHGVAVQPPPISPAARPRKGSAPDGRIGQTLRLAPPAWEQLKVLAIKQRVTTHALMIEAVNDLFEKHGLPPIA